MARSPATVQVKRIYDEPGSADGQRILVDRIWPRGISKDRARVDEWCKEVAPSTQLRTWYGHDRSRYEEFARRYRDELRQTERAAALDHLRQLAKAGPLTLVTATRESDISQAAVLAGVLKST